MLVNKKQHIRHYFILIFINITLFLLLHPIKVIKYVLSDNTEIVSIIAILISSLLPLVLINIYMIGEFEILPFSYNSQFNYSNRYSIFSNKFKVYCSIFECVSFDSAQFEDFTQFSKFHAISIEFLMEKGRLRIFVFGNRLENLMERVTELKPVVETILPGVSLLSSKTVKKILTSYSNVKIGNFHFIKYNNRYFFPINHSSKDKLLDNTNRIVFNNSLTRNNKNHKYGSTQIYYFKEVAISNFFNLFGSHIYHLEKYQESCLTNAECISQAIHRLRIETNQEFVSTDGINTLRKYISTFIFEKDDKLGEERGVSTQNISEIVPRKKNSKNSNDLQINQICRELCNILQNKEYDTKKGMHYCQKRSELSKKLILNNNFIDLIAELTEISDYKYRKEFIKNLKNHLSFQQIYCMVAHLIMNRELNGSSWDHQSFLIDLLQYYQETERSKNKIHQKFRSNENKKMVTV